MGGGGWLGKGRKNEARSVSSRQTPPSTSRQTHLAYSSLYTMDALKAEIALKRKTIDSSNGQPRPSKYMRKGDIERLREEQEKQDREERQRRDNEQKQADRVQQTAVVCLVFVLPHTPLAHIPPTREQPISRSPSSPFPDSQQHSPSPNPESSFNISNEETIRRLRAKGQPIRLFGESDKDRRLRLRALELIEEKEHERHGGQNDFKKALEDVESRAQKEMDLQKARKKEGRESKDTSTAEVLDLTLVKSDPDKLYPIIYYALKRTLKEWEEWMDDRPGDSLFSPPLHHAPSNPSQSRASQANHSRKTRCCNPATIRRVPQTPLQAPSFKGMSHPFLKSPFDAHSRPSHSQMTC